MDLKLAFALVALSLFAIGAGLVLLDDHALRDESVLAPKPYSLARVQLWWWTVLIWAGCTLSYGMSKQLWQFNGTCLALLTISGTTAYIARLIDRGDSAQGANRHQDAAKAPSGFLVDLLWDKRGLSLHRLQSAVFHVIYGAAFAMDIFSSSCAALPSFDARNLVLLGLSSATYLTLKALENAATPGGGVTPLREAHDEFLGTGDHTNEPRSDPRARTARARPCRPPRST